MATNNAINLQGPTPAFRVYTNAAHSNLTGDGTLAKWPCEGVSYDTTSSVASSIFTAPVAGVYNFNGQIFIVGLTSSHTAGNAYYSINGATTDDLFRLNTWACSNNGYLCIPFSQDFSLAVGNTVQLKVEVYNGTKVATTTNSYPTIFCGRLIALI